MIVVGVAVVNGEVADSPSAETPVVLGVSNAERKDICHENALTRVGVEAWVVGPPQNASSAERKVISLGSAPREAETNVLTVRRRDTFRETVRPSER